MVGIQGVYEVAIKVRDLGAAELFYRDVLGLEVGLRDANRPWIFMRAGPGGMIVLQEQADVPPIDVPTALSTSEPRRAIRRQLDSAASSHRRV